MARILCLGEALVDFTSLGISASGNPVFEQNPGGAPANVARNLARAGIDVAFAGVVGDDSFGRFLRDVLAADGVDILGLKTTPEATTTLAFVHLDRQGERSFTFVRSPGADSLLTTRDVPQSLLADKDMVYCGSVALSREPAASTVLTAMSQAWERGATVCFDVNLRPLLWQSLKDATERILAALALCQVVKVSLDELSFVLSACTGAGTVGTRGEESDVLADAVSLFAHFGVLRLLAVTMGAAGSVIFWRKKGSDVEQMSFRAIPVDQIIDTTGAGDAYFASLLSGIAAADGLERLLADSSLIQKAGERASLSASQCLARRGAV